MGKKMDKFMPRIYAKDHEIYMTSYLKTGKEDVLNKKRYVFGVGFDGYIFPTQIYIKFNPNIKDGISYIGLLRPQFKECTRYYMLLYADGRIDSISKKLSEKLFLTSECLLQKSIFLWELSQEFSVINQIMNYFIPKDVKKNIISRIDV